MPGFGSGPFGREPFGEWKWSRQVLYEYVPELYRASDPDGLFELFIEALRGQFDKQRHLIRDFANLRSALLVRTQFDDVERLRLGPVIVPQGELEQQGISARVDALFQFVAPTGRFRAADEGKELRVSGSTVVGNNRAVTIIKVLSLTTVLTDPQLRTDSGSLRWEVREKVSVPTDHITVEVRGGDVSRVNPGWYVYDGRANFEILQRRQFAQKGVFAFQNEREGSDGVLLSAPYFQAETGDFSEKDVGKWITLANSSYAANNTRFEIVGINRATSPPTLTLRGPETTPDTGLFWALLPHPELALNGTGIPLGVVQQEGVDGVLVSASMTFTSATALFSSADVDKWILFVGLSGYDRPIEAQIVSVTDANTVVLSLAAPASFTDVVWELRSTPLAGEVEKSGIDLEITEIDFADNRIATVLVPSGTFRPADVGFELRLTNSSITNNNDTYVIIDVVDLDVIKIQRGYPSPSGSAITVDDGPLTWELIEPQFTPLTTDSGVLTRVQAHAQSHIQQWAPDFGIEIDTQESEAR